MDSYTTVVLANLLIILSLSIVLSVFGLIMMQIIRLLHGVIHVANNIDDIVEEMAPKQVNSTFINEEIIANAEELPKLKPLQNTPEKFRSLSLPGT
jgi:hypothetical protein